MAISRRILITGLSSPWGGRLAHRLESRPEVEAIIGIDTEDPRLELQRTEFVRVGTEPDLLRRIIHSARIDTIVDTRLTSDTFATGAARARAVNVDDTRKLLLAAGASDTPVRKVVFKSSAIYYGASAGGPAFFTEEMPPSSSPRSSVEQDVVAAERSLAEFRTVLPQTIVTVLRPAIELGPGLRGSHLALLALPVIPGILGFDPRWQFVHEDDVLDALTYSVAHELPGSFNLAADGVLALSEVAGLLGKPLLPLLPPWGTLLAASRLRRLGLKVPIELLVDLRHGRGLDNSKLKLAGFTLRYTSREAVLKLRAHHRLRPLLGRGEDPYRYEREVEEFLRWSPSVQSSSPGSGSSTGSRSRSAGGPAGGHGPPAPGGALDDLTERELLDVIPSLETDAMINLRIHELAGASRDEILAEIDHQLALRDVPTAD